MRGDIQTIDLVGRVGRRPDEVITRQNVLNYLNKVTVGELTSKGKGYPTEVFIEQKANLTKSSFGQSERIHTVAKHKLEKYLGTLYPKTLKGISWRIVLLLELKGSLHTT